MKHSSFLWSGKTPDERFESKIDKTGSCWMWTGWVGGPAGKQYGYIRINGKRLRAHKYAYMKAYATDPGGLLVCHICDVKTCVNPEHLFLGTHQDNVDDMIKKGRKRIFSKLSSVDVLKIREMFSTGKFFHKDLAKLFKVSQSNITAIINNKRWQNVIATGG